MLSTVPSVASLDCLVHGPQRSLGLTVLNPLRSEAEAFRLLLYVIVVAVVIVALVLILRATT